MDLQTVQLKQNDNNDFTARETLSTVQTIRNIQKLISMPISTRETRRVTYKPLIKRPTVLLPEKPFKINVMPSSIPSTVPSLVDDIEQLMRSKNVSFPLDSKLDRLLLVRPHHLSHV